MDKQTKVVEEYEEIKSEQKIWKPENGVTLEGKILKKQKSNFGMSYVIENDDGMFLLPNHTILTSLLDRCNIGDFVKIVCNGSIPSKEGKNPTMQYKVFLKK